MISDYLALGALIAARLREQLPALQMVAELHNAADLEERLKSRRVAAFVIYDGDRLGDTAGRGQAMIVQQRWLVVLAVRNARGADHADGVRAEAGPLISRMIAALSGWQASADHRPLVRVAAPAPGYSPAFAYYPLAFESAISTLGD